MTHRKRTSIPKVKESPVKAYAKAHTDINALLEIVRARLPQGDCRNATWNQVGTLQSVRAKLEYLACALGGYPGGSEVAALADLRTEVAALRSGAAS